MAGEVYVINNVSLVGTAAPGSSFGGDVNYLNLQTFCIQRRPGVSPGLRGEPGALFARHRASIISSVGAISALLRQPD
jgi:hypothetical protein